MSADLISGNKTIECHMAPPMAEPRALTLDMFLNNKRNKRRKTEDDSEATVCVSDSRSESGCDADIIQSQSSVDLLESSSSTVSLTESLPGTALCTYCSVISEVIVLIV